MLNVINIVSCSKIYAKPSYIYGNYANILIPVPSHSGSIIPPFRVRRFVYIPQTMQIATLTQITNLDFKTKEILRDALKMWGNY